MRKAFTLVEVLIVAAIVGILAAIVIPEFQSYVQQAKEAAAKDNLRILRVAIERYAAEHNDIPPGYQDGDPSNAPTATAFSWQLKANNYLLMIPENPLSGITPIYVLDDGEVFPAEPVLSNLFGWVYQPATKTIKVNSEGTDSAGVAYFDY